jgi:tetratricopeptide (TPR) repeat protein
VAIFSRDLANLYAEQERYDESEVFFGEAVRIFVANYGRSHYEIRKTLTDFASMLAASGRQSEADRYYERAAAIPETRR